MYGPSPIQSLEWLLNFATSITFLIPGYLVVKFLQSTREMRTLDNLEISIRSLIFSLLITFIWFYLTPIGKEIRVSVTSEPLNTLGFLNGSRIFSSLAWLLGCTAVVALIFGYIEKYQIYWKLLNALKFHRLSSAITTWEEMSDLSKGRWVSISTVSNIKYIGIVKSVTPYPHERALILTRSPEFPIQLFNTVTKEKKLLDVDYVWLAGAEIKSIGVYPHNPEANG